MLQMDSGCVAQLVERLLPIPDVRGSNPVIGKKFVYCQLSIEKTKIKKKRPGLAHLKKYAAEPDLNPFKSSHHEVGKYWASNQIA